MRLKFSGLLLLIVLVPAVLQAQTPVALALRLGSQGGGAEVAVGLAEKISARAGVYGLTYEFSATESDIDYDAELSLFSLSGLVDWHPTGGGPRLTGGLVINQNGLDLTSELAATYEVGGTVYTVEDVGNLLAEVDFNGVAPYLGVGWGRPAGAGQWTFLVDLGVIMQGSPQIDLSATGPIASEEEFQANMAREEDELQDELDGLSVYPVASIGLAYRF
ncbi:MAG: hypothetical protein GKR89_12175 [Candidatus Latescibacteria bacterium]|nr:hypothetical protein [Candidatus Latescibacterota bacterium]